MKAFFVLCLLFVVSLGEIPSLQHPSGDSADVFHSRGYHGTDFARSSLTGIRKANIHSFEDVFQSFSAVSCSIAKDQMSLIVNVPFDEITFAEKKMIKVSHLVGGGACFEDATSYLSHSVSGFVIKESEYSGMAAIEIRLKETPLEDLYEDDDLHVRVEFLGASYAPNYHLNNASSKPVVVKWETDADKALVGGRSARDPFTLLCDECSIQYNGRIVIDFIIEVATGSRYKATSGHMYTEGDWTGVLNLLVRADSRRGKISRDYRAISSSERAPPTKTTKIKVGRIYFRVSLSSIFKYHVGFEFEKYDTRFESSHSISPTSGSWFSHHCDTNFVGAKLYPKCSPLGNVSTLVNNVKMSSNAAPKGYLDTTLIIEFRATIDWSRRASRIKPIYISQTENLKVSQTFGREPNPQNTQDVVSFLGLYVEASVDYGRYKTASKQTNDKAYLDIESHLVVGEVLPFEKRYFVVADGTEIVLPGSEARLEKYESVAKIMAAGPADFVLTATGDDLLGMVDICTGHNASFGLSCGYGGHYQVVSQFTFPNSGIYSIDTSGSSFDTIVEVRGDGWYGFAEACNDDALFPNLTSKVLFKAGADEKKLIVVSGYDVSCGKVKLNVHQENINYTKIGFGNSDDPLRTSFSIYYSNLVDLFSDISFNQFSIGLLDVVVLPGTYSVYYPILVDYYEEYSVTFRSVNGELTGIGSAENTIFEGRKQSGGFDIEIPYGSINFEGIAFKNFVQWNHSGGAFNVRDAVEFGAKKCVFEDNLVIGSYGFARGAAIAVEKTTQSCVFISSIFQNNRARAGGAVYLGNDTSASFTYCSFYENYAETGGAVQIGPAVLTSRLRSAGAVFDLCEFDSNYAFTGDARGGAICNYGTQDPIEMHESNFTNNVATFGGAVASYEAGALVDDCYFASNKAFGNDPFLENVLGGAVFVSGESKYMSGNVTLVIVDSEFTENSVVGYGGAICVMDGSLSIERSNFFLNFNDYSDGDGGAIFQLGGYLHIDDETNVAGNSWCPYDEGYTKFNVAWFAFSDWKESYCNMCEIELREGGCAAIDCDYGDPLLNYTCNPRTGCEYSYLSPVPIMYSITPSNGPLEGGFTVRIEGEYLGSVSSVYLAGVLCEDLNVANATYIECTAGTADFAVVGVVLAEGTNGDSEMEDSPQFEYFTTQYDPAIKTLHFSNAGSLTDVSLGPIGVLNKDAAVPRGSSILMVEVPRDEGSIQMSVATFNPDAVMTYAGNQFDKTKDFTLVPNEPVNIKTVSQNGQFGVSYYIVPVDEKGSGSTLYTSFAAVLFVLCLF